MLRKSVCSYMILNLRRFNECSGSNCWSMPFPSTGEGATSLKGELSGLGYVSGRETCMSSLPDHVIVCAGSRCASGNLPCIASWKRIRAVLLKAISQSVLTEFLLRLSNLTRVSIFTPALIKLVSRRPLPGLTAVLSQVSCRAMRHALPARTV